jgi:hypothetical protein
MKENYLLTASKNQTDLTILFLKEKSHVKKQPACNTSTSLILIYSTRKKFLDLSSSSFLCLLNYGTTMEFLSGDIVEVCSEEEGFLGSYHVATAVKKPEANSYAVQYENLVEDEYMSKQLIETHRKPSSKTP